METNLMQRMYKQIEKKLKYAFSPIYLMVIDETDQHNVPSGMETHFKVILVTEKFATQNMVNRHRAIYQILENELNSIHALVLRTYTPTEWEQRQQKAFASPDCCG